MESVLSWIWPRVFNWRIIDKGQFRLYLITHLLALVSIFHLPDNWVLLLAVSHTLVMDRIRKPWRSPTLLPWPIKDEATFTTLMQKGGYVPKRRKTYRF